MFPKRTLQLLALLVLLLALLATVWLLPRWLAPPRVAELAPPAGCDLSAAPCRIEDGRRSVELELAPRQVRALEPLEFRVRTQGMDTTAVSIQLEGKEMYMGINQLQLQPVAGEPGLWRGVGELAVCTTGEMIWQARIRVATGHDGDLNALFEFSAR